MTTKSTVPSQAIEALFAEERKFPPSAEFVAQANVDASIYEEAERDFEEFWAKLARERVTWIKPFEKTLEWDLPFAKWFVGGKLNVAYNCVDRHVENGLGNKVAYHWIGEPGDTRTITYADLQREVEQDRQRAAGAGHPDRRSRRDLHADDPGAAHRDARLRPHRCAAHGRVRRLLAEALAGRIQDATGQARHHRRRRLAARQAGRPQAGRR